MYYIIAGEQIITNHTEMPRQEYLQSLADDLGEHVYVIRGEHSGMSAEPAPVAEPVIGKAYRSSEDGVIRWFIGKSQRGYYHCRWLDEDRNQWHYGGSFRDVAPAMLAEEVSAPQPGSTIMLVGPTGVPTISIV